MRKPKDLRKRLEELNRKTSLPQKKESSGKEQVRRAVRGLRERSSESRNQAIHFSRDLPRREGGPPTAPRESGEHIVLEETVEGEECTVPGGGRAYLIEDDPEQLQGEPGGIWSRFRAALSCDDSGLNHQLEHLWGAGRPEASELIFLDLETTGLFGTPLFLVGTMEWADGGFVVRQYLARDYSEEAAAISLAAARLAAKKVLVTFNGKSFDMPYMRARAAVNAVQLAREPPHLDLLHVCRRFWRGRLPNCRLQTLESGICGRERQGDIPGAEIPAAYHHYVRTGNAVLMVEILRHNMLDLLTMADLAQRLPPARERH